MKKGLTIARKVASRDVIYRCREFLMKKRLMDREKGTLNVHLPFNVNLFLYMNIIFVTIDIP